MTQLTPWRHAQAATNLTGIRNCRAHNDLPDFSTGCIERTVPTRDNVSHTSGDKCKRSPALNDAYEHLEVALCFEEYENQIT